MTRTLLIVDDLKSNRDILKNILGHDYRILEAEHGQEALALMAGEHEEISAVLLDLGMPVMDGYEVLAYMQTNERLSQLPVIVTTGQTDAGSEERALRLGAKDYIQKPYKSAIIRQRIWNTINLRETAAAVNALQRDALTGLYSRDAFFEKVRTAVAAREPGYYTMACFDVDRFKVINDQYGTSKGDEVLQHIAGVFRACFEPIGGLCCRISGDDFATIYPTAFQTSPQLAEARRLASLVDGLTAPIAFSIGRYVIVDPSMPPSMMFDRAMMAADSIKGRYDTRIACYDESMRDHLLHEQQIVTDMEAALHADQFEIWYQPQFNHSTGALIGAEALVRWNHPEKGMISPGEFVSVFEQNGFIYSLDQYVWEGVCRYLRKELDEKRSPLPVSVNVSRYDILRPDLVETLTGLVERYGLSVDLLRLEVTESAFAESMRDIVDVVKRLIAFGFTLEIDDFGSGYSSLNTLKNVPAQVLKLDMRFLEDDEGSERGGNILESVVRMAKWLGMSVIAEGVERKTQADFLRSIGCSYVQGYLYAKPMPEDAYRRLCGSAEKEEKLLTMETVENLDNNTFWNPESMDTLIFNSYVGGACIYEYNQGRIELLRATEKYAQVIGSAGMTVEAALKLDWVEHLDKESATRVLRDLDRSVQTRQEVTGEYVFLDLPGCPHETFLRSTMRVIASVGTRYLVYCTNENITAQRVAERGERMISEQLQAVMDNVACGITAVTVNGEHIHYLLSNERYYELLGYTRRQYVDEVGAKAFTTIYQDDRARVADMLAAVERTGEPITIEYRAIRRDGRVVWLRSILSRFLSGSIGESVQLSTYTDITEQKRSELALRDTTEQLRTMMDDMPGGYVRMHVASDGRITPVYINEGFQKLVGMHEDEIRALYDSDALTGVHPDDVEVVRTTIASMLQNGKARSARYRLLGGSGSYIWLSVFGRATKDPSGDVFLNVYYTDATEQIRAEEEQKALLDNLPCGTALYEFDGQKRKLTAVHLNKRYWELVDRKEGADFSTAFLNAVYADDKPFVLRELTAAIREKRDIACDVRLLYGDSAYRPFHIAGRILPKKDGAYAIYAAYTPITEDTMSVQELLPIALSAMMGSQTDYTFVKDKKLRYVCASREVAAMLGLDSPAEMLGKSDYELFDKALADAFYRDDSHILATGESLIDNIDRLPSVNGVDRYACTSKYPLKDSQGNTVGVYGIGRDVTETRAMRTQFELLTNSIPGGLATYEARGDMVRITYFSDGFCRLFDTSREAYAALGEYTVFAGIYPEDLPALKKQLAALLDDSTPVDCVYRVRLHSGSYKWINLKATMTERDGDRAVFNAMLVDVTARQEAMERMRISEEENRLALQHTSNTVCRYDVRTRTLHVPKLSNKAFTIPAYMENVPDGPVAAGDISPETAESYKAFYASIQNGDETGAVTYQRMSSQGWRWLEAHYSTIYSDAGEPVSAVISFLDITERLEKESAYTKWQQSFQSKPAETYSLYRCNISMKTSFDTTGGALIKARFAPGTFDFDGRTELYAAQYVLDDDRDRFTAFLNADALLSGYYQGKRIVSMEYREKQPDGNARWLRLTVDLVEHACSADIEGYLLFEDIDQAKRHELATIEQAETDPLTGVMNRATFAARVNALLQTSKPNTQHALMMLDLDGFKQVNDAFGHGAGDQSLVDIAHALRTVLRHDDLVGRLGGDEFLLFLYDIPGDVIAAAKAKQICALARKAFSAEVYISGSIGIAFAPRDGGDFETLYKRADAALYHVKGSGKDTYAFFQDDMAAEHLRVQPTPKSDASAPQSKLKRRMLIVDDSRIDHALLTNIFADDFIIEKAKDGNTALIRLRHYGTAISVVLLDLMMPGMDGFTVLRKMQESAELRNVPVIVVSGDENREISLRAIRNGAVDFVTKPVDPDILRIRVQSAVSRADNERLRAKNSLLEYQNNEVMRYKTALEHSGITVVEHDWVTGTFLYDASITEFLAGTYDSRGLWHVLLSDLVADTKTVQCMQELVQRIAMDRKRSGETILVQLKTPSKSKHWFRMNVYKLINEFGLAGKIYMTFVDLGTERLVTE